MFQLFYSSSSNCYLLIFFFYIQLITTSFEYNFELVNANSNNNDEIITKSDYIITIYSQTSEKPCFYFSESRFSQREYNLINCTWYKENACCKRTEVASVFSSMYTLNRASQTCMNLMNYMMCYFCSPEQYVWWRNNKVLICLNFCDEIYKECKKAEYAGRTIEEIYKDGRDFCEAQNFEVIKRNEQCFDYDPEVFSASTKMRFFISIEISLVIFSLSLSLLI